VENILFHERKVTVVRTYSKKVDEELNSKFQFFKIKIKFYLGRL